MQHFTHKSPNTGTIGYTANDFLDYVTFGIRHQWFVNKVPFTSVKLNLTAETKEIHDYCIGKGFLGYDSGRHTDLFVSDEGLGCYIMVTDEDGNNAMTFYGNHSVIDPMIEDFKQFFAVTSSYVSWVYDQQYLSTMKIPLSSDRLPKTSFYPFLNGESLDDYYKRFIESDASILLLYGNPGGGKSSFIKGLIVSTGQNAMVTYHHKLLENDELFGNWYQSPENLLVIEDADTMLAPRADGNTMMDRFLNIGDGLVTMKKKKMIFSTNLPNTSSIDEALLRPGRCHDILQFGSLTFDQAKQVARECGVAGPTEDKNYTIAEIFSDSKTRKSPKKQSFGFY